MAETELTTAQADALSGTTEPDTDAKYPAIGESTYYTTMYRLIDRLLTVAKAVNALRVYKDGDLTCGARAGKCRHGNNLYAYAGAAAQALTDDTTNYLYLVVSSGALVLTVNTTGFPDPASTAHLPLATIATGTASAGGESGTYGAEDITDYRGRALFSLIG